MAAKKDVEKADKVQYSPEELQKVSSFEEALNLVASKVGQEGVLSAEQEIGDGFKLLDNKDNLLGVEMLLVNWDFHPGDHGEFVSAHVVTKSGDKYIVNDGSSGMRDQLMQLSARTNSYSGLFCRKGLRRSDYEHTDENGKKTPAKTYYLDTSA